MDWAVNVAVHDSAFPQHTRVRILAALRRSEIDPALLYSGWRQSERWVALHRGVAPSQRDAAFQRIYSEAFSEAAARARGNVLHVVGLGCGDGTKDAECLRVLREKGKTVIYSPCDISLEMALTAERAACSSSRGMQCTPLLFDLLTCTTMPGLLKSFDPSASERLVLFLGTLHNYPPVEALKAVLHSARGQDQLIISANLAPSVHYEDSVRGILPQYDNPLTRDWLMGSLLELGITTEDGELLFSVEPSPFDQRLLRIEVSFRFARSKVVRFAGEDLKFEAGSRLLVFYSARFTIPLVRGCLAAAGLEVQNEWVTSSEEEGVFLCGRPAKT